MPKRFSLLDCGDKQVVVSGYIKPNSLPDIPEFLELLENTSSYDKLDITISGMLFLDFKDTPETNATAVEVKILQEKLPELFDLGYIVVGEVIELSLRGLAEEEIVEHGDI